MSVAWLHPAAWFGLAAVGVPLLIHLLIRQQSRRMLFPSLRFLRPTAVASWRRHRVSDWPLLVVRALILTAAVAALAAPVFITEARRNRWGQRVSRAIVVVAGNDGPATLVTETTDELILRERARSAFSAAFTARGPVADAVRDAVAWLERQPPSRHELVIAGDLRRGAVTSGDLSQVPASAGIRFEPVPIAAPQVVELTAVADNGDGGTQSYDVRVTPTDRATDVVYRPSPASADWLAVQAPAAEQREAEAARAATLAEGLVRDVRQARRMTVVFPGEGMLRAADLSKPAPSSWMVDAGARLDGLAAGEHEGQFVVLSDVRASDSAAVDLVASAATAALQPSRDALEPLPLPAERLASWSRPPGPADEQAPPRDEGDRRWLWALALALLAVEQLLRRFRRPRRSSAAVATDREARVA